MKNQKKIKKALQNQLLVLLFVISLKFKMQKAISNKIQLGETLNPLHDYGRVPSINDEGTLENLITKVDKVQGFIKTGKGDGDLSRYFPNILPITRQVRIAGTYQEKLTQVLDIQTKNNLNLC